MRPSVLSIRAWMSPIHAWKSLSMIFTVGLFRIGQGLQHFALQHLDLLLRRLQLLLAESSKLQATLVGGEGFLERELAALHSRHDFFQLGESSLEGKLA